MIRFTCAFPGRVAAIRRAARLPLIAAAFAACGAARASEPPPAVEPAAPRYLRLVYFTPADREPYPDHRGRGYAAALSRTVVGEVIAAGEAVFLHAFADHGRTIAFYRSLGFEVRAQMLYTILAD